jgi:hypothetical protein
VLIQARVTALGLLAVTATAAVWLPDGTSNSLAASVAVVVVIGLPGVLGLPPGVPGLPPILPPGLPPIAPPGLVPILPPGLLPSGEPPVVPLPLPPGLVPVTPPALPPILPPILGSPPGSPTPGSPTPPVTPTPPVAPAPPAAPAGPMLPFPGTRIPQGPPPLADPQLWTVDAGTGAGAALTEPARPCPPGARCVAVPLRGRTAAWSPDGLRVAYDRDGAIRIATLVSRTGRAEVPEAVRTDVAVTGPDTPSRPTLSVSADPAWAPDGLRLAVSGQPAGRPDQLGIYLLLPDGTGLHTLAQGPGPETEPAWQPYTDVRVTLTVDPSKLEQNGTTQVTATLTNAGRAPAAESTLDILVAPGLGVSVVPAGCSFAAGPVDCPLGTVEVGGSRTVTFAVSGETVGTQAVTATVATATPDVEAADDAQTVLVEVVPPGTLRHSDLSVSIQVAQNPTYLGATTETVTVTVANRGPDADEDVRLAMTYPPIVSASGMPPCLAGGPPCPIGRLAAGERRLLIAPLAVLRTGTGRITARVSGASVDPRAADDLASVPIIVRQPALRLLPPIGEPGFVTLAYGTGLPAGSAVRLVWEPGITADPGPFTVAADGTVRVPVLLVRRDVDLGERVLVLTSTTGLFGPLHATMLVVPRTTSVSGHEPPFLGRD